MDIKNLAVCMCVQCQINLRLLLLCGREWDRLRQRIQPQAANYLITFDELIEIGF